MGPVVDHVEQYGASGPQEITDLGGRDGVDDVAATPLLFDEPGSSQHRELVREAARLALDLGQQLVDGVGSLAQKLEDADADRMPERPEELRLGLVQRT